MLPLSPVHRNKYQETCRKRAWSFSFDRRNKLPHNTRSIQTSIGKARQPLHTQKSIHAIAIFGPKTWQRAKLLFRSSASDKADQASDPLAGADEAAPSHAECLER